VPTPPASCGRFSHVFMMALTALYGSFAGEFLGFRDLEPVVQAIVNAQQQPKVSKRITSANLCAGSLPAQRHGISCRQSRGLSVQEGLGLMAALSSFTAKKLDMRCNSGR
jgi:hypothetical protein